MASVYNIPTHKKGDTFTGVTFTVLVNGTPLNLTGSAIKMDIRVGNVLKKRIDNGTTGGVTLLNAGAGVFTIDKQIIDIPARTYDYDIQFTLANGDVKTYIIGTWTIVQDITYE
jgi:hypothetical protein